MLSKRKNCTICDLLSGTRHKYYYSYYYYSYFLCLDLEYSRVVLSRRLIKLRGKFFFRHDCLIS